MIEVLVAITPVGFTLPVTFVHVVREHLNLGLFEAKAILDRLANDKAVTVHVASEPTARAFADAVEALGGLTATIVPYPATDFFESIAPRGPEFTELLAAGAERTLGVRLPRAYLNLLRQCNGGEPKRRCFRTEAPTSWAADHFEVKTLLGVGYERGIDGKFGSAYMVPEWGYAPIGVTLFDTPSGGHDTVMLDYSMCGPRGEPRVAYVDEARIPIVMADSFAEFVARLEPREAFAPLVL